MQLFGTELVSIGAQAARVVDSIITYYVSPIMDTLDHTINNRLKQPGFNADAFQLILQLGGAAFVKLSGCRNLVYRSATRKNPLFVRLDLAANEHGYTRLKIHLISPEAVAMHFYRHEQLPAGELVLSGQMLSPVEPEHMANVFETETGIVLARSSGPAVG